VRSAQIGVQDGPRGTSHTSHTRSAHAAITGYAYQFDLTTLEILGADDGDTIIIEGCEDIDLERGTGPESVQCKYLAAAKYSLVGMRKALLPMLRAFVDGRLCDYRLYVHYGDPTGVPETLTIKEFKEALTERKRNPSSVVKHHRGIQDATLEAFLERFTIQSGPAFDQQQTQVRKALRTALTATPEDVCDLYYPKAVSIILDLAMQPDESKRRITRPEFMTLLDKRRELYTRWHAEIVGAGRMHALLKRRIKKVGLLARDKRRLIVLAPPSTGEAAGLVKITDLVEKLATTDYGQGKLSSAKPWTVVYDAPAAEVLRLKRCLLGRGVAYYDGFETVQFSPTMFSREPTINTYPSSQKIKSTSYDIRVVSAKTYRAHMTELQPPSVAISFAGSPAGDFVNSNFAQTLDVPGTRSEDILDLFGGLI
jgi:hypothetical protein